jgi:AcrR family transcriptional regulator
MTKGHKKASVNKDSVDHPWREALLRATQARALRVGFHRIRMQEVAADAGVSRRTLYRAFPTRDALFVALFEMRVYASAVPKVLRLVRGRDFRHALHSGTLLMLRMVQKDRVLMDMAFGSGAPWFQVQMLDRRSQLFGVIMAVQMEIWGATLNAARGAGVINPTPTNRQILEWTTLAQFMTVMAQKGRRAEQEFILENFLIPSLLRTDHVPDESGAQGARAAMRTLNKPLAR